MDSSILSSIASKADLLNNDYGRRISSSLSPVDSALEMTDDKHYTNSSSPLSSIDSAIYRSESVSGSEETDKQETPSREEIWSQWDDLPLLEHFAREACVFDVKQWDDEEIPGDIWYWEIQYWKTFSGFFFDLNLDKPEEFQSQLHAMLQEDEVSGLPFFPPGFFEDTCSDMRYLEKEAFQLRSVVEFVNVFNTTKSKIWKWNTFVNIRVLSVGLSPFEGIDVYDAGRAWICPEFLPSKISRDVASRGVVDFCIGITGDYDLEPYISNLLDCQPEGQDTINQTKFHTMRSVPCVIPVKTFLEAGDFEDSSYPGFLCQTLWASAYFKRMRMLNIPGREIRSLTYPMICVRRFQWTLSFAREKEGKINVYQTVRLGATNTISELYLLVNNLKLLGQWVVEEYVPWLREIVKKTSSIGKSPTPQGSPIFDGLTGSG